MKSFSVLNLPGLVFVTLLFYLSPKFIVTIGFKLHPTNNSSVFFIISINCMALSIVIGPRFEMFSTSCVNVEMKRRGANTKKRNLASKLEGAIIFIK